MVEGDLKKGAKLFKSKCAQCHTLGKGEAVKQGPNLYGLFGRQAGASAYGGYSDGVKSAGFAWDAEKLDEWVTNPKKMIPGNKMVFAGLKKEADKNNLIAFLEAKTA